MKFQISNFKFLISNHWKLGRTERERGRSAASGARQRWKVFEIGNSRQGRVGFSLIEILVAFSLISVLSTVGFVSFVSYSRRQVVVQAAANVKQAVDLARYNTVSFVKPSVCGGADKLSSYKLNFCFNASCQDSNASYEMVVICGSREEVLESKVFPKDVVVTNVPGVSNCSTIIFNLISGNSQGLPCEMYISGYGNQIKVSIDSIGHVSY